jgi:hypothetical protein
VFGVVFLLLLDELEHDDEDEDVDDADDEDEMYGNADTELDVT